MYSVVEPLPTLRLFALSSHRPLVLINYPKTYKELNCLRLLFIHSHDLWTKGESHQDDTSYLNKGWKPFLTIYIFTLHDHKMWRLYILYTKLGPLASKLGLFNPKIDRKGPFPNKSPTHGHELATNLNKSSI